MSQEFNRISSKFTSFFSFALNAASGDSSIASGLCEKSDPLSSERNGKNQAKSQQ